MTRLLLFFLIFPEPLLAAPGGIPGESLSLWWSLPFIGMLASLALMPLFAKHIWEAHYGKIALGWSFISIFSLIVSFDASLALYEILNSFLLHYLPFVIMIGALYVISGGIQIDVDAHATPLLNTGLLAIGTFLAGWIGTTGASMLLIRPLMHINRDRKYCVHHIVFFIFLVANIGGALTPLGDPPLFIGFLNDIPFFWPLKNLTLDVIVVGFPLLLIFYGLDQFFIMREGLFLRNTQVRIKVKGKHNGILFLGVIGLVLLSSIETPNLYVSIGQIHLKIPDLVRDGGLILLAVISWVFTTPEIHRANYFSWEPLKEVIKLFFGVFMTVIPVIAILGAGQQGVMGSLIALVDHDGIPQNQMYFWLTGGLSAILDNAPTYLVFFYIAGGDATLLRSSLSSTLEAISLGAVFMGAMTYIGNAPNFMVKTIAESQKIQMPSFFGYLVWSLGILLPLFLLLSWWRF